MANDLPPLPLEWCKVVDADGVKVPVFRAFQMRDFARAAVLAERAAFEAECAAWVERATSEPMLSVARELMAFCRKRSTP